MNAVTFEKVQDRLMLVIGDITKQRVDAIVNAANEELRGGGGVDGAIHVAAGFEKLHAACKKLGSCKPGEAKITPGFKLLARFIIHTVGPRYRDGKSGESEILAACYRNSLKIAQIRGFKSIAFPAISTGIFGYPKEEAADVAVETVVDFISSKPWDIEVRFVSYLLEDAKAYAAYFPHLRSRHSYPL